MSDLVGPVARAIETIYEAGFEAELWQSGLAALCRSVDAHSAITVPRQAADDTLHLPFSPELGDLAREFVAEGWYQRDLRAIRGWPLVDAGQNVVFEQDIFTPEDHRREPLYQELMARHGVLWWAGVTFRSAGRQYVLSLYRTPGQEPFDETERRLFQAMTGHLSRALTIAEQLALASGRGSLGMLEAMDHGGILVDRRGRVVEMNATAEAVLGDGLAVSGGRLAASDADVDRRLQALVSRTLVEGAQAEGLLRIERRDRRPLLLDVLPIPVDSSAPLLFAKALVMIIDLDARPVPAPARLMGVFSFSASEASLATRLASGLSLQDAADDLRISRETARTHLKSVFVKTDTNRQSDLVALLQRVGQVARG